MVLRAPTGERLAAGDSAPDGGVLLLQQRAELLVQVAGLLRQLGVPQAHAAARLVDQVDGLVGQEPAPARRASGCQSRAPHSIARGIGTC